MEKLLNIPEVSQKDLDSAKKVLQDKDEKLKARSSLQNWLKTKGATNLYNSKGIGFKREFFEKWLLS